MMDIDRQPNFSNDQVPKCQSSRSNPRQCGKLRKISIGILMDSIAKSGPKNVNCKDSVVLTDENVTLSKANSAEDAKGMEGVLYAANEGKQTEALKQEASPWLSTGSFRQILPTSKQVHNAEPTHVSLATGPITEIYVEKVPSANSSLSFLANQMAVLESKKGSQRMFDGDNFGIKETTAEGVENLSLATVLKVMPQKGVVEDKATKEETRGSETLRMKLWEILGTISSPNKKQPSFENLDGSQNMKSIEKNAVESNPVLKTGQNLDIIKCSSECPACPVRRPRTRSLIKKRASDRSKATIMNNEQSTCCQKENQENNTSFREGFSARLHYAVSGDSLTFMGKKSDRWSPGIKARTMCFHKQENPVQNQQVKDTGKRGPLLEKSLSHGMGDNNELRRGRKSEFIEPKSVAVEIDSHQLHLKDASVHLRNSIGSPKLQTNVDWQDDGHSFLKNISEKNFYIPGPIFGVNTPNERSSPDFPPIEMKIHSARSSPGFPPKSNPGIADDDSPAKMISNTEGIQSFKSFLTSKLTCDISDFQSNSSDVAGVLAGSFHMKPRPIVEESESRLFESSFDDSDSETLKEGSHVKGNEDNIRLQQNLELNQEDDFASAVSLFALALERFKSKMKSVIRKRSAEILMSVAEGIRMQLETVESQIQADMGKLTSLNKSKRKHLEMGFQELQGELNIIHAKFKEEVHQHLQDCRHTVDGLNAHQMKLRGTMEKQSTSHIKLLLQAKEVIETQLNDAGRRVTELHNLAREKMLQLKIVVADCFKGGDFCWHGFI